MKRRKKSNGWPAIIEYAEEKLRLTKLRVQQLEALIAVFRAHFEAGDPCPSDLAASTTTDKYPAKG
jgi:hypothetical protein